MARYYLAWRFNDGSWSEIDVTRPGSPTYRAAMEDAAAIQQESAKHGAPIRAVRVFLDMASVDLANREDFLNLLAYDPVMKVLFEYARQGGQTGLSPTQVMEALATMELAAKNSRKALAAAPSDEPLPEAEAQGAREQRHALLERIIGEIDAWANARHMEGVRTPAQVWPGLAALLEEARQ